MRLLLCALVTLTLCAPCWARSVTPTAAISERTTYRDEMLAAIRELSWLDRRVDELERRYDELFHRRVFYPNAPRYNARSSFLDTADSPSDDERRQIQLLDDEIWKLEQDMGKVEERRFQIHWLEDEIRTRT